MSQVNITNTPESSGALHEYRITKLEEAYATMSDALAEMVVTIKGGKWALAFTFGIVQPVAIAMLIFFLTNKG